MRLFVKQQRKEVRTITVKEIRIKVLKMTQQNISDALGITKSAYCRKENGQREFKWKEILRICELSGVDPRLIED